MFEHVGAQYIGAGEAEEDVGAGHGVAQFAPALVCNGVAHFACVHAFAVFTGLVNHAFGVAHGDVFAFHAQSHEQVETGDGGGTGT